MVSGKCQPSSNKKVTPRIIFVAHTSQLNGADRSLFSLVTELTKKNKIEPLVLLPRRGPLYHHFKAENIPTLVCPAVRWVGKRFMKLHALVSASTIFFCLLRSLPTIRRFQPNLIYSNTFATGFGIMLAYFMGKPHVLHIREFIEEDFGMHFVFGSSRSTRLASRVTNHVICNSGAVAKKFRPLFKDIPVSIVYNGFSCSKPLKQTQTTNINIDHERFNLLFAGALSEGKNQLEAIEALALIRSKEIDAHLYLAGTGRKQYVELLETRCCALGLEDAVHFLGFVENLSADYTAADAVLICSRSEAFGRVLIEAMCYGTPVVAASSGSMPELILHGETGLLYEPGDSSSLADNVQQLTQSIKLRNAISKNAKERVDREFSLEKYTSQVLDVVDSVLNPATKTMG